MKSTFLLTLLGCLIFSTVSANNELTQQYPNLFLKEEVKDLNNGWGKFYIGAVIEPLGIGSSDITFAYRDESPSGDNLIADIDLASSNQAYGLVVGMEFSSPSGFTWSLDGTFSTSNKNNLSGANLGLGWRFRVGKPFIQTMLKSGIGNGNFKLGNIQNNDEFIEVNDTQFYSDEVTVQLRHQYAYLAPELSVFVPVKDTWGLQFSGSYKFAFNRGERISFRGHEDVEETITAKANEELSEQNVFLLVDNIRITDEANLMEFGGFKAQITLVFFSGR